MRQDTVIDLPKVVRYYHGGPRGLRMILPSKFHATKGQRAFGNHLVRDDKVYVTTLRDAALIYAVQHAKCSIYEVEPIGQLTEDPDCQQAGVSFEVDKARVIREYQVKPSEAKLARAILIKSFEEEEAAGKV